MFQGAPMQLIIENDPAHCGTHGSNEGLLDFLRRMTSRLLKTIGADPMFYFINVGRV